MNLFKFWDNLTKPKPNLHERKKLPTLPIKALNKIGVHLWAKVQNYPVEYAGRGYKLEKITPCKGTAFLHISSKVKAKVIIETNFSNDIKALECIFHESIYKSKGWYF